MKMSISQYVHSSPNVDDVSYGKTLNFLDRFVNAASIVTYVDINK